MNKGELAEVRYSKAYPNAIRQPLLAHSHDFKSAEYGTIELKSFCGSRPSLGGITILKNVYNIRQAIDNYLIGVDTLAIELMENEFIHLPHDNAIDWLLDRVVLARVSSKRGGGFKLRISAKPRTNKATAAFLSAGYAIA